MFEGRFRYIVYVVYIKQRAKFRRQVKRWLHFFKGVFMIMYDGLLLTMVIKKVTNGQDHFKQIAF